MPLKKRRVVVSAIPSMQEVPKAVPVADLEVELPDGQPVVRGVWVRVKHPSNLVPGRFLEFTGEVKRVEREPSGRVLLWVAPPDVDYLRPAVLSSCASRRPPRRVKVTDQAEVKRANEKIRKHLEHEAREAEARRNGA